jgi:maleate isomerase
MSMTPHIESLPFETDAGLGQRARIGLIILQTDQTIEHEFASLLRGDGVALYHARIPNAMEVTRETLGQMENDLPTAAELLPEQFNFDAIGYCCTSGATMIGETRVDQIIRQTHADAQTSNPLTACKAALAALGLKRIALVTPYAPSVTTEMRQNIQTAGFRINAVASFNQSDDFTAARISSQSILNAVQEIGASEDCDGVFVSCTSLRTLPIIAAAEAHLGKPVISSNQALAWHLMRLANIDDCPPNAGQLFQKQLAQRG